MHTLKKMTRRIKMNNYSTITTEELDKRYKLLHSKSEGMRLSIMKQCSELDALYKELIVLSKELKERGTK